MHMLRRESHPHVVFTATQSLLLQLAKALHQYGIPAHRLENTISHIAEALGMEMTIFSMPTGLLVSFQGQDEYAPSTHMLRVDNGDLNIEKQSDIDALAGSLLRQEITASEAALALQEIQDRPPRYTRWMIVVAFVITAIAVARIFGGGWRELLLSTIGGGMTGVLAVTMGGHPHMGKLLPAVSSFSTALVLAALTVWTGPVALSACHMASIIVLIPGLSLTIAMTEISTQHLVSGTARLAGAVGVLLQIGFGLGLGSEVGRQLFGVVANQPSGSLPGWTFWPALILASGSFVVLFQARPKDLGYFVMIGVIAMVGARWGSQWLGPRIGPFVAALMVGLASNLFARLAQRPASTLLLPGIILLVPGSVGVTSITAMMNHQAVQGITAAFTMLMVTISLVAGLLVAALLLPPKRHL